MIFTLSLFYHGLMWADWETARVIWVFMGWCLLYVTGASSVYEINWFSEAFLVVLFILKASIVGSLEGIRRYRTRRPVKTNKKLMWGHDQHEQFCRSQYCWSRRTPVKLPLYLLNSFYSYLGNFTNYISCVDISHKQLFFFFKEWRTKYKLDYYKTDHKKQQEDRTSDSRIKKTPYEYRDNASDKQLFLIYVIMWTPFFVCF